MQNCNMQIRRKDNQINGEGNISTEKSRSKYSDPNKVWMLNLRTTQLDNTTTIIQDTTSVRKRIQN